MTRRATRVALALLVAAPAATPLHAQADSGGALPRVATATVFARYSDHILKIQVMETSSNAKASIGTGFFVSGDGLMLTNYHVVAERIQEPENYRVEVVDREGAAHVAEVVAVDVVHDLAVIRTGLASPRHFTLGAVTPRQGDRLYSLGHPSDLGLSIVEGTYNGNLKHTLYPKIHFTGSINPGMSGGPTITESGRVVGVNVSTMGEQRSFLVPEAQATALVGRVLAPGFTPSTDLLEDITAQLTAYQQDYLGSLFEGDATMVDMGAFRVVTEPAPVFRCWGGAERGEEMLYEQLWQRCATDDEVYIDGDQSSGVVRIVHEALHSKGLNGPRFSVLYSQRFADDNTPSGNEKHVTRWKCTTRNVATAGTPMRAVLCLRALRKMEGLYDAVLKVALLGRPDDGLVSTLTLSGASFANIERLTTRYLGLVAWR
ncbi:MAG: serine protease [Gemmatimonadota bacterium]|nr:serine protease [Gemmatimonadota bacterium]